jgi:hypothetical protein
MRAYISLKCPFLAIHAKGGESISPKQKDRTTTNFKNVVFQIWVKKKIQFGILFLVEFQIGTTLSKLISKTLLNTKRRILLRGSWTLRGEFYWGEVLFSQRKSIWNRGRKFQILKMLLIYLWLFAKGLWKEFTKVFAKTKHVVQAWSKILNMKKASMHILWEYILVQF